MASPPAKVVLGAGLPLLVILVLLAAWGIDTNAAHGRVPRNVRLAGRNIGRMPERELRAAVRNVAKRYSTIEVEVATPGRSYKVPAGMLGLALDEKATIQAALAVGKKDALPLRPVTWLSSFVAHRSAPLRFRVRQEVLESALASLSGRGNAGPREPSIVATTGRVGFISGSSSVAIDPATVSDALLERASSGELPIVVRARAVDRRPKVSDAQAKAFADTITARTARPLVVVAGRQLVSFQPATVRSWLASAVGPGGMVLRLDSDKALADLRGAVTSVTQTRDATFVPYGLTVAITPSQDGTRCCAKDTPDRLLAAVNGGKGLAEVALVVDKPSLTTEAAQKLGIKEPVGTTTDWKGIAQVKSFTTYYAPGQSRVTNIHLIADAVRGTVIKPGETFSVNGRVGKRTRDKGYLVAPVIESGRAATDIGGGVSQFSTTLFNAAFFAGLDFVKYQSHSVHFDRYPYGREATLGFPEPDEQIKNNTPYGVLIWTSYSPTSVTVTLYSTQNVYGLQTAQTRSRVRACTQVVTTRTRYYLDGRTAADTVGSLYRPAEGVNC